MDPITLLLDGQPCDLPVHHSREGSDDIYTVDTAPLKPEVAPGERWLDLQLDFLDARAGDPGYYVLPYSNKCTFLTEFKDREDTDLSMRCLMPMFGAKQKDRAVLIVVEGMRYSCSLRVQIRNGNYALSLRWNLHAYVHEPIRIRVVTLPGSARTYVDIAKAYRAYVIPRKGMRPLAERAKTEPAIAYAAAGMPIIRVRMAWKPAPSPVREQTLETEPAMHVACTFADVEALMEEMKAQGIERAEICLVGWNIRGHDGRWPQVFPVEPELGGEEGLKKLTAHAKALGYRIVAHTNSSDAYRISQYWDEADIIKDRRGQLSKNAVWSGGQMYNLCPRVALEKHLPRELPHLTRLGFQGFHYVDVLSIVPPRPCYDPAHPLTTEESTACTCRLMQTLRESFGGVGSEGAYDFCAEAQDFALYVGFNTLSGYPAIADRIVPLWQLVYHGYIFSNPSTETVNYTLKKNSHRLRFFEYGGIPVNYLFTCFVGQTEGSPGNWMGDEDLYCRTPEQRKEAAGQIKKAMDEYLPFAPRQLAFMDDHRELAPGVYETVYSDGWHTVVNYTDRDHTVNGQTVPAGAVFQFA